MCENGLINSGGVLALECHRDYTLEVSSLLESSEIFEKVVVITDLQGESRHVIARSKVN